jgi:hypothetical protein
MRITLKIIYKFTNHQDTIESLEIKDGGLIRQLRKNKKENIDYF